MVLLIRKRKIEMARIKMVVILADRYGDRDRRSLGVEGVNFVRVDILVG